MLQFSAIALVPPEGARTHHGAGYCADVGAGAVNEN